jgi:hypothetical protein
VSNRDSFVLKLMKTKGMSLEEAEAFVEDLDIPEAPAAGQHARQAWEAGDSFQVRRGTGEGERAVTDRFIVAQRGPNGMTARQQAGLDRGVGLCPNCQQPADDHIPGCLRDPRNGFRPEEQQRAVTKGTMSPTG